MKKQRFNLEEYKESAGFTMVEILIVLGIIVILSAFLISIGGGEQEKVNLRIAAVKLSQNIREAQEKSMGAEEKNCPTSPAYSFGVYLSLENLDSYQIFADCNGNYQKDGGDSLVRTEQFEEKIEIKSLSENPMNIVFTPPGPKTFVNGDSSEEASITLFISSLSGGEKTIKVNPAGRIEVE